VFQVFRQDLGIIAAKVIKKRKFDIKEWATGLQLGKDHQNPFVPKYLSADPHGENVVILMEYANLGDLDSIIDNTSKNIPISVFRAILKQILEGLRIMHKQGLIHRDIKGGNILLHNPPGTEKIVLKIADYGLVKVIKNIGKSTKMSYAGTQSHMAPELLIGNEEGDVKADDKIDIWSTGILAFQLLTHKYPFKSAKLPAIMSI
ncbi:MAG: putative MAP kinase kinase family domain protein, partial [Streblomastix strix]